MALGFIGASPTVKVFLSFLAGVFFTALLMVNYQTIHQQFRKITTFGKLQPLSYLIGEAGDDVLRSAVRERYLGCNQTNILCGGDASWDSLSIKDAQRIFHRKMQTYQYDCKKRKYLGKQGDGGYTVCLDEGISPRYNNCLVYSFGINNEWSFDDGIRQHLKCEVHSFDPSMHKEDHIHKPGVFFHNLGIWGTDMVKPNGWKLKTLNSIRKLLGHTQRGIDLLKIDVEGAEWPALRDMLLSGDLRDVKQLILEIHTWVLILRSIDHQESMFKIMWPRGIDLLKIDVEGAEWPALRDMLLSGDLRDVKQLILEIHTPKYRRLRDPEMGIQDYAEMFNYYTSLELERFKLFSMLDRNYCCLSFNDLISEEVRGRKPKLCCYETFLVNERFFPKNKTLKVGAPPR